MQLKDDYTMDMVTKLRYYHFIAGVFASQQHDPLCSVCKAFTNTVQQVQQEIEAYVMTDATELTALPEQESVMLAEIRTMLAKLHPVADAAGQKKAGNCKLPKGVCYIKSSKALGEAII